MRRECRTCGAGACACPEWRACRVCGKRAQVEASGRFPAHRIVREWCPGSGQFVERWDALAKRRVVARLVARRSVWDAWDTRSKAEEARLREAAMLGEGAFA